MDKSITGIVTWLKNWFYDKDELNELVFDEEEYSSSSTTALTKTLNPNYKLDNGLNWIFSCDIKITGNVSSRLELSPLGLDRGHHISIGVNTAGTSSLWWTPSSDSGETGETITTLTKNTYYHLDFIKQGNSISIYLDNVVLKTLTFDWFKKYDFLVKLTTWGTANNGIAVKNIYINHKNVQVSPNEVGEYIVGTQASATNKWTGKSNKLTKLQNGTVIYYKLPYASTNADVTLNLTLADGSTTGEKNVWFWNGSRVRTQYGVYSVVGLVYNGSEWWVINPSTNNSYDYLRVPTRIVNGESSQIPANSIICGCQDSNGVGKYYILKDGVVLDTQYPILFNTSAMNSGSYTDNTYVSHTGVTLRNNVSDATVTSQKQIYIEGTSYINGKFTVSSNVFKSEDNLVTGNYYIYIGVSYSAYQIRFNSLHQQVYRMTNDGLIAVNKPIVELIPNNVDLDGYIEVGFYYCDSNNNITNVENTPTGNNTAFSLIVDGYGAVRRQIATTYHSANPRTFIRMYNDWTNPKWGAWKEMARTTDAPASHGHGKVTSGGTLSETTTSVKNVVVTDTTNNNLRVINKVPFANLNISKSDITGLGIPSSDTNTTYSKGDGLLLSGTTFSADFGTGNNQVARGNHTHSGYASSTHNHDGTYSPVGHGHTTNEINHNFQNTSLPNIKAELEQEVGQTLSEVDISQSEVNLLIDNILGKLGAKFTLIEQSTSGALKVYSNGMWTYITFNGTFNIAEGIYTIQNENCRPFYNIINSKVHTGHGFASGVVILPNGKINHKNNNANSTATSASLYGSVFYPNVTMFE